MTGREAREDTPRLAFAALAQRFAGDPRVTEPAEKRGKFGANGLRVDGKIFAMLVGDALAVKLSRDDVDAEVKAGRGERLAMGNGRVMKEWLVVHAAPQAWLDLARRAMRFVAAQPAARR